MEQNPLDVAARAISQLLPVAPDCGARWGTAHVSSGWISNPASGVLGFELVNRRALLGAGIVTGLVSGCGLGHSYELIYRFKIVVRAGQELRIASSTIHVRFADSRNFCFYECFPHTVRGEAITLELGGGRQVFALLRWAVPRAGDYPADMPLYVLRRALPEPATAGNDEGFPKLFSRISELRDEVELSEEDLPLFVRFDDVLDPGSVERVVPRAFARAFGPTVSFVR